MRAVVRFMMATTLSLAMTACVSYNNFYEGIACFRAQQYRAAFIHLKPEAAKGQPDAQYAVGYMYYYGEGVVEDRRKAWYWINRAAEKGQPDAIQAIKILSNRPTPQTLHALGVGPH